MKKRSLDLSLQWTSLFRSITFSPYGPTQPVGGMNENGLIVEALLMKDAQYPVRNHNLNEFEIIQYILDRAASINEANQIHVLTNHSQADALTYDSSGTGSPLCSGSHLRALRCLPISGIRQHPITQIWLLRSTL